MIIWLSDLAVLALALGLIGSAAGSLAGLAATRGAPTQLPRRSLRRRGQTTWRLLGALAGVGLALLCVGYSVPAWVLALALAALVLQVLPVPAALCRRDGWDQTRLVAAVTLPPLKLVAWIAGGLAAAAGAVALVALLLGAIAGVAVGLMWALRPLLAIPFVGYPVAGAAVGLWLGATLALMLAGRRTRPSAIAIIVWSCLLGAVGGHVVRRLGVVIPGAGVAVLAGLAAVAAWVLLHPVHLRIAVAQLARRSTNEGPKLALPVFVVGALGGTATAAATTGTVPLGTVLTYSIAVLVWLVFWTTSDLMLGAPTRRTAGPRIGLSRDGRRWAHTTGTLAGLNTALSVAAPLIALGRAESAEGGQRLLLFSSATLFVGFAGLLLSRLGGAPTPRKLVAVGTVALPALAFGLDRLVQSDATFLVAFAVSGLVIPLLSTLGDQTAAHFPDYIGEYHARRQQVAARLSAVAVCLPVLEVIGLGGWVSVILALLFAYQAVVLSRLRWLNKPQASRLWRLPTRLMRGVPGVHGWMTRHLGSAPASEGFKGGWKKPVFAIAVAVFFVGQLLGTAAGAAVSTVLEGAEFAAVAALWLPLSRLVASTSNHSAGRLADAHLERRGIFRAGVLFLVGGAAFWLTGLVHGWALIVTAGIAFFALTQGLNPLLVIARALTSRFVGAKTAMVDLGWTGTFAGGIGAAVIPWVLPPGAGGAGTNLVALGVLTCGLAAFALSRALHRLPTN